jgi:hypothetical protein
MLVFVGDIAMGSSIDGFLSQTFNIASFIVVLFYQLSFDFLDLHQLFFKVFVENGALSFNPFNLFVNPFDVLAYGNFSLGALLLEGVILKHSHHIDRFPLCLKYLFPQFFRQLLFLLERSLKFVQSLLLSSYCSTNVY